jgi:LasA protease
MPDRRIPAVISMRQLGAGKFILHRISFLAMWVLILAVIAACTRAAPAIQPWSLPTDQANPTRLAVTTTSTPLFAIQRSPGAPILSPTPDLPHLIPTQADAPQQYVVQSGDMLGAIAERYSVPLDEMIKANNLTDPDHLEVGQTLTIPVTTPQATGTSFKIIPDSELVYSLSNAGFSVADFLSSQDGYINQVQDEIEGDVLPAAEVIAWVARDYSVNPRLLLAVLEYQSGWITHTQVDESTIQSPVGVITGKTGLYKQLAWAADNLNQGYYLWRANAVPSWILADGSIVPIAPTLNAGTAGVQHMFAQLMEKTQWDKAVSAQGLFNTYESLFGYPFDYAIDPLVPEGLQQPVMQLPFEPGVIWSFTGGPHGGWGSGSAWAGLDFAPSGDSLGCYSSDDWVTAVTPGTIIRSEKGRVVEELDGDGWEQTGWSVLYMHIEERDRIAVGTRVNTGDRLGHPSCEGGYTTGTHTHLARRFNGEWIPADSSLPFDLDGWISTGTGVEYDGYLYRDGETLEAYNGRSEQNQIQR